MTRRRGDAETRRWFLSASPRPRVSASGPPEAYGAFAYAYDQSLGASFFAALTPLLNHVLDKYPAADRTHLDLACGTGFAAGYFEQHGFRSTGLDASLPMLGLARQRARRLVAGDLRSLPLRGTFGRITCFYDSLNHLLHKRDLGRAFGCVRGLMSPRSLYLFDMNKPKVYRTVWSVKAPFLSSGHDYRLSIETSYSRWTRQGRGRVSGWVNWKGKRYNIDEERFQRSYTRDQILRAVARAGLKPIEIIDFDPFPAGSAVQADQAKWLFVAAPK